MEGQFRLGDWLVEPALNRISRASGAIRLEPRLMELLTFFARRPNEVLARETLIDGVWQTHFVGEAVLRNTVCQLRRALGDQPANPRYIETITKRGYRLIAPVSGAGSGGCEEPTARPTRYTMTWEGREIPLVDGDNLIGRDPGAVLRVDHPEVSRRHARLIVTDTSVTLEDLGSKNGTYLNGRSLTAAEQLADGDEVWIGLTIAKLRFRARSEKTRTERNARRATTRRRSRRAG